VLNQAPPSLRQRQIGAMMTLVGFAFGVAFCVLPVLFLLRGIEWWDIFFEILPLGVVGLVLFVI
jgi:hypothetical protein